MASPVEAWLDAVEAVEVVDFAFPFPPAFSFGALLGLFAGGL